MYAKRLILTCLLLVGAWMASAQQYYSSVNGGKQYFLSLSFAGGEANTFCQNDKVKDQIGGAAQLSFAYELFYRGLFFNVGVGLDYMLTRQQVLDFTDAFERLDKEGEALTYRYLYADYQEQQHTLSATIPVQLGYVAGHFYAAVGAKLMLPVMHTYATSTSMFTQGEYERFIEPFLDIPEYGFYTTDTYHYKGLSQATGQTKVAATVELGGNLPLENTKQRLRIGVYAEYLLPTGDINRVNLTDYSQVDISPLTQTQDNLRQNLKLNSWLDNSLQTKLAHSLQVGLRLTVLFDVTPKRYPCRCEGIQ